MLRPREVAPQWVADQVPAMRIAIFITCFNDTLFPETGKAMVRVLEALGLSPEFPAAQTCCGQVHFNTGYRREALSLAERFVEVFRGFDAVVAPSASCVSMVRDQFPVLEERLKRFHQNHPIPK